MRSVHEWPATRVWFDVTRGPSAPLLGITVTLDAGAAPASIAGEYDLICEAFETGGNEEDIEPAVDVACDTNGTLSSGDLTHDTHGVSLAARLATFASDARAWLYAGGSRGTPPAMTAFLPLASDFPTGWTADLQPLSVRLRLVHDGEIAVSELPPDSAGTFAPALEDAFTGFDGHDTRLKVATSPHGGLWLLRWGRPGGTHVTFPSDARPPVVLVIPPLATAPITREVDGRAFTSVDLDSLASEFLSALDGSVSRSEQINAIRRGLAGAIGATVEPAWRTPGDTFNAGAATKAVSRMLEDDLTLSSRAASIAQIGARVESPVASGATSERRLGGSVVVAGPNSMATGGVPLGAGGTTLEVMLAPDEAGALTSLTLSPVFSAERIDEPGAAPLQVAFPESIPFGPVTMPVPLRTAPPPVTVREVAASQDDDGGASPFEPTWRYAVTVGRPSARQDVLTVQIAFNGGSTSGATPATNPAPAQAALFDAMARFMVAHAEGAADHVERARAVVEAWEQWTPDAAPAIDQPKGGVPSTYTIGLDEDGATLIVEAIGASIAPEVWPALTGYAIERPAPGARRVRFVPAGHAPGDTLTLVFDSLDPRRISRVRASLWIERNRNVARAGQRLDPRFVRRGPVSALDDARPPTLRNRAPIALTPAPSLLVALQRLFATMGTSAAIEMAIQYSYAMGEMKARMPVLLLPKGAGTSPSEVARALSAWQEQVSPREGGALEFEIKVWGGDEPDGRTPPLLWFTDVSLEVPGARAWWTGGR